MAIEKGIVPVHRITRCRVLQCARARSRHRIVDLRRSASMYGKPVVDESTDHSSFLEQYGTDEQGILRSAKFHEMYPFEEQIDLPDRFVRTMKILC